MRFSLMIPCYGVAAYLPALLASLRAQTYRQFEVWFVDDGSVDGGLEALEAEVAAQALRHQAGDPVCYHLLRQENQGVAVARNVARCAATGDYLYWIDGDDFLLPHTLEKLADFLDEVGWVDLVYFDFQTVDEAGRPLEPHALKLPPKRVLNTLQAEQFLTPVAPWNKLYRRAWLNPLPLAYPIGVAYEDLGFYLKVLAQKPRWAYCPKPLYAYRLRAGSAMHKALSPKHLDIHRVLDEVTTFYQRLPADQQPPAAWVEAACAYHGYLAALTRVLRAGGQGRTLEPYQRYRLRACPHYQKSPHLTRKQKGLGWLYDHRLYTLARRLIGQDPAHKTAKNQAK